MARRVLIPVIALAAIPLSACEEAGETGAAEPSETVAEETVPEAEPIFTGVGQEPGWFLRIYDDVIVYEADYGERRVTARTPEMQEFDGGRRYENDSILVEILDEPCTDAMSGAPYPAIVTITERGSSPVQGCGGDA